MYPNQKAIANALPGITQNLHAALRIYKKKKGSQHAIKLPMINPNINVARFSFFLANLLFSLSGSRGLCGLGSAGSHSLFVCFFSCLLELSAFLPKMGWHMRSLSGLTTAQREITPESEEEGSNSETISVSMATLGARQRSRVSPFSGRAAARSWQVARGFRVTWADVTTWNKAGWRISQSQSRSQNQNRSQNESRRRNLH